MKKKTKKRTTNRLCKVGMEVQTILFESDKWTRAQARSWLLEHKLKAVKGVIEGNNLRYRQAPVSRFEKDSFRTKSIPRKGIKLVVACPKKSKKPSAARKVNERIKVPRVLVELGKAVEIALDGKLMKFRGYALASNTSGNKLFVVKKTVKKSARASECSEVKKARELYSKFTEFEAEQDYRVSAGSTDFHKIGTADHIVYQSDKWSGKKVEYIHEFVTPPSIYQNRNKTIFVLSGKIKVKKEGITG